MGVFVPFPRQPRGHPATVRDAPVCLILIAFTISVPVTSSAQIKLV
jgi:hypothetical protein